MTTKRPWHQDEAYWYHGFAHAGTSVWMPLQRAVPENGCMQFVLGSHRLDVVPHHLIDADAHALEADDPVGADEPCRTLRYAAANRTDQPRRVHNGLLGAPAAAARAGGTSTGSARSGMRRAEEAGLQGIAIKNLSKLFPGGVKAVDARLGVGDALELAVDTGELHFFDPDSGRALEAAA